MLNKSRNQIVIFISFIIILILFFGVFKLHSVPTQNKNQQIEKEKYIRITNYQQIEEGTFILSIPSFNILTDYQIIIYRPRSLQVYYQDKIVPTTHENYSVFNLDSTYYNEQSCSYDFIIKFSDEKTTLDAFFAPKDFVQKYITLETSLIYFSLGILFTMLLFSMSLYCFKNNESYLLNFTLYLIVLLIWILYSPSSSPSLLATLWNGSQRYLYLLVVIISVITCFTLSANNMISSTKNKFVFLFFVTGIILSYNYLPVTYYEIIRYLAFIPGLYSLLINNETENKGISIILLGFCVSQGLRLLPLLCDNNLISSSILLSCSRSAKIFELPFAIACLFATNYRYAKGYKNSETLSKELDTINKELDYKVAERTKEVINKEKEKHNLMLNIFHDLRSPLFILKGCLELLENDIGDNENITYMEQRLAYVEELVDDLFFIVKLEDNKLLLTFDTVNISSLCDELYETNKVISQNRHIDFLKSIDENCFVWGDRLHLYRAIQNLISNSFIYTNGFGSVSLNVFHKEEYIIIEINDTGKGISEEDLPNIFKKYYHIKKNGNQNSTGLGLTIAKDIIELHEGIIKVDSKLDVGTTFTIQFPILKTKYNPLINKSE